MMKTRNLFFALVVGLALAAVPMVGCGGDTEDPSANNSEQNNTDKKDVGGETKEDVGGETKEDVGGDDKKDVGGDDKKDVDNGGDGCAVNTTFYGQVGGTTAPDGGSWTTDFTVLAEDAGIQAVLDAVPNAPTKDTTKQDHSAAPLEIRGATLIASHHKDVSKGIFWVQDQNAGLRIRLAIADNLSETVRVGQIVNFDITATQIFDGHLQVEKLTNFEIVEEGTEVPYSDVTGKDISPELYNTNVRVSGKLVGEGNACGGSSICYDLKHGDKTVTFRSASQFVATDTCVTFFGPLNLNPGPSRDDVTDPTIQLDTGNYGWFTDRD